MKKNHKITFCLLMILFCFAFLMGSNLYAAEKWWTVSVDQVIVKTTPSVVYNVKVTNPNGPWTYWLNFTNKELLATALTAKSLDLGATVTVKFDDATFALLQMNL